MKEPKFRCETKKAIEELIVELDLPENTQDWCWIVAQPKDIEKYIAHYNSISDEDKKFTLMEIIIQATTDQADEMDFLKYWEIVKSFLKNNFKIHEYSVFYWCCFDNEDVEDCWKITPYMRQLWSEENID